MSGLAHWLEQARARVALDDDDGGERAYLEALKIDGANFEALNDLGVLAHRRGRRTAARLTHQRALRFHPESAIAHVNLANILSEEEDPAARDHYRTALAIDPTFAAAHKGLARFYEREGDGRAEAHWRLGGGEAVSLRPRRGVGPAIPVLLIVSAKLGNMPIDPWLDDRLFEAAIVEIEYVAEAAPVPPHAAAINLIGDADLCGEALAKAERWMKAPVLNPPARVAATGRLDNARRLGALPGVITPEMRELRRPELAPAALAFPLLLRAPGFHAGRHFTRVDRREELCAALAELPGDTLLAMSCLDARGPDGLSRKYRVMSIDGRLYPLHLAISSDWKVHYFSAAMAEDSGRRDEERRFLDEPEAVLGPVAWGALAAIQQEVGLDYFGVDFALSPEGALLLFEANAAMAMLDPPPDPLWDYRRPALAAARAAAREMVMRRARGAPFSRLREKVAEGRMRVVRLPRPHPSPLPQAGEGAYPGDFRP